MNESGPSIFETTDPTFDADVFVRSQLGLVIVDFWADWCAPCRMLAPMLESIAEEYAGQLTIVKADTEQNQSAAQQFSVSSIPALFAIYDGNVVSQFAQGANEVALRAWIDDLLAELDLVAIEKLIETDPEQAEQRLQALESEQSADRVQILKAKLLLSQNHHEECREILDSLAARGFLEPEAERIQATLALAGAESLDLEDLRDRATSAPEDFDIQLTLSKALAARKEYQEAFEIALHLVSVDRKQTGEKARELMVNAFRVLGDDSDVTREYRRKLSMVLY